MKKQIFILLILNLVFTCCNNKKENIQKTEISITGNDFYLRKFNDKKKVDELINKIVNKGDTVSYCYLYNIYAASNHRDDFMFYSILMANKFKYKRAYYDSYNYLDRMKSNLLNPSDTLNLLDKTTQELAKDYLKKSGYNSN